MLYYIYYSIIIFTKQTIHCEIVHPIRSAKHVMNILVHLNKNSGENVNFQVQFPPSVYTNLCDISGARMNMRLRLWT